MRYVPVDAAEMQRLLAAATEHSDEDSIPAAGALTAARYRATLNEKGLLNGEMEIDVRHEAKDTKYLPLSPCRVALRDPSWVAPQSRRPALTGVDPEDILRLAVSQPGTFHAIWTLQGKQVAEGDWEFVLAFPNIPSSRLTLDVPQGLLPWVESGVVSKLPGGAVGFRRWQIDLEARPATRLLLVPESPDPMLSRAVARQSLHYEASPRGWELTARLTFELGPRPRGQLKVKMDAGLQLLDARMGDSALNWSVLPAGEEQPREFVLDFPEAIAGGPRVVQLRAVAPLTLGQRQTLPALMPQDIFWQEGTATVSIPSPLALQELNLSGCRQTKAGSLAGAAGRSVTLQYFRPDARVEFRVDRPAVPLTIVSATSLELTPRETRGRVVADCSVTAGESFDVTAAVMPGWHIEQVESEPVGGLEHWGTVRDGSQIRLEARLARAVTPKRSLRLTFSGRLTESAAARPIPLATLRMLRFGGDVTQTGLIGLTAAKPHQLQLRGDEDVAWIDPGQLDAAARSRFQDWSADLIVQDDRGAKRLEAGLVRQAASHAADIQVTMHVHRGTLEEVARIQCRPDSGGLDRLLIHASQLRTVPFQWSLVGEEGVALSANRLSDAAQREAGYAGGETWEIVLDRPRTAPFTLAARRTLPWEGTTEALLFAVAPVAEQRGTITIRGDTGDALQVDNLRLQPIPNEYVSPEKINTTRGTYRYDPERDAILPQSMLLITRTKSGTLTPGIVAWKARYDGRCQADGVTLHEVQLCLENRGQRQLHFEIPAGTTLAEMSVDGAAIQGTTDQQRISLELPVDRRFPLVRILYVGREKNWGLWQRIAPALPAFHCPVLQWDGFLWTPPGFQVVGAEAESRDRLLANWRSRLSGPLARQSGQTDRVTPDAEAREGSNPTEIAANPWATSTQVEAADRSWTGWAANRVAVGGNSMPSVVVMQESLWIAGGWSIYLFSAVALAWLFPRRVHGYAVLLLALALAALAAPASIAPVATMALLGAATAALVTLLLPDTLRWLSARDIDRSDTTWASASSLVLPSTWTQWQGDARPQHDDGSGRGKASTASRPSASGSSVRRGLLVWMAISSALPATTHSWGDAPAAEPKETVYKILIPIDKDRQPSGDTWYVPLELYCALAERAAPRSPNRHGWLITGGRYRGALQWNLAQTRLEMDELRVSYDLEVLGRQVPVRLPLGRNSVTLLPGGAKLDGRTIEPVWDERGQGLFVDVAEPGRHRVDLDLRPLPLEGDVPGVELATPPLPTASLEVSLPTMAPSVEVPSALGSVGSGSSPSKLTAQLGGADKLSIRWPQPSVSGMTASAQVKQLWWLKIAPGAVTIDARLKLRGFEGRRGALWIHVDPCLRLLSAENAAGTALPTRVATGPNPMTVIESGNGFAADEEVSLSLLWADTSALGRFRLPEIRPLNAESTGRWLAVSVDPSLSFRVSDAAELAAIAPAELATRWQIAGALPALAYVLPPREEVSWTIATEPQTPRTSVQQSVALSLAEHEAAVRYVAQLETAGGSVFQHRLRLPKNLTVSDVTLTLPSGRDDCVARWSQTDGVLTILLDRPVTGIQRLALGGTWVLSDSQVPPPHFHLGDDETAQNLDLALFRQPGVDAVPTDAEAIHELSEPTTDLLRLTEGLPRWFGRPVGSFRLVSPTAATIFRVVPAAPKTDATQITTLSRSEGVWQAEVEVRLQVQDGMLDTVRLATAPSLRGPLRVVPETPFQIVEEPGQRRRQLVIRPREAVRDSVRLNITGPLTFVAGERVAAPRVELLLDEPGAEPGAARLAQFLVLPTQVEQQRVEWDLRGVRRQDLPPDGDSPPVASESVNTYRVLSSRFQAALASVEKIERAPRIPLADVRLRLDQGEQAHGVAAFDLEPAGLWKCVLTSPPGIEPLRVAVGSLAVPLQPLEENRWEFNLVSNQLPQRIEILFQGQTGSGGQPLSVPWISAQGGPLEVAQTLWTVDAPRGTSLAMDPAAVPLSSLGQQWLRLDSVTSTLDETSADESADILARWYEPWAFDIQQAWREIGRHRTDSAEAADSLAARLQENRKRQQLIAQRLRTRDVLDRAVHATVPARPAASVWGWSRGEDAPAPLRIASTGAARELSVQRRALLSSDSTVRLLWAALVACGLGLLVWRRTGPATAKVISAWPWVTAILLGVVGYFLLSPGFLLPVLALLAAAAWRAKSNPGERGGASPLAVPNA